MSDNAIRVKNLGKLYPIGQGPTAPYATLRDRMASALNAPIRQLRSVIRPGLNGASESMRDSIWALKDVSFDVKRGEVVGIIGRNGAGKSTLLKILSRITEPTTGYAELRGRIASLLEVGTGFHPELTGRENIYLNAAILGMKRSEIARQFDAIVAFAEIETFIDTPVKHYSSGMYVRLAFAVAAHLEPEILVVDEVLAVGDAAFQKKCLGKMEAIGREGRTVLFISHSMPTILRLCRRAILLEQGYVSDDGCSEQVTRNYMRSHTGSVAVREWVLDTAPGDTVAKLRSVRIKNRHSSIAETIDIREPVYIEVEYWHLQSQARPTVILHVINEDDICLFASNDFSNALWWNTPRTTGLVRATCEIPGNFLAEGHVFILVAIGSYNPNKIHVMERDAVSFQVVDRSQGDGVRGVHAGNWPGLLRPMLDWQVDQLTATSS